MLYFLSVGRALALLCYIFRVCNTLWCHCVIFFLVWNALWRYCAIFSARGMRSGVIALFFPSVERTLELLYYISARGILSGVILIYFPSVECALELLCYIFPRVERALE